MKKLVLDAFEIAQENNSNELEEIKAKINNSKYQKEHVKPQEITIGTRYKNEKIINSNFYYVPISKCIQKYRKVFDLDVNNLEMALYMDEVSLVNPIGIFAIEIYLVSPSRCF